MNINEFIADQNKKRLGYNNNEILVEANRRLIERLSAKYSGNFGLVKDKHSKKLVKKLREAVTIAREIEFYESLNNDGTYHNVCGDEPMIAEMVHHVLRALGKAKSHAGMESL